MSIRKKQGFAAAAALCLLTIPLMPTPANAEPPAHDDFVDAKEIGSLPYSDSFGPWEISHEPDERTRVSCESDLPSTVWYRYTADSVQTLKAHTANEYETFVVVWTGPNLYELSEVACFNGGTNWGPTGAYFATTPGTTYYFQVSGWGYNERAFHLEASNAGFISGTVTSEAGGFVWTCVNLLDPQLNYVAEDGTNKWGQYSLSEIPPGTYHVEFIPNCLTRWDHEPEYHDDSRELEGAQEIVITEGSPPITGIDAALTPDPDVPLEVSVWGSGSGVITSEPAGIECRSECESQFPWDSTVTLTAKPDPGSKFVSWSGCDIDRGNHPRCTVTQEYDWQWVVAQFEPLDENPETTITEAPPWDLSSRDATFHFESTAQPATFECSLDGQASVPCNSPLTYTDLTEETHYLEVRSFDAAGTPDPTPSLWAWEPDVTPPETTLVHEVPAVTRSSFAYFEPYGNEFPEMFECSLDGAPFASCGFEVEYEGLAEGDHSFRVRAIDRAGNVDPTPEEWTWRIVRTGPETKVTSGPEEVSTSSDATFTFESTDPSATFGCSLDDGEFTDCASPKTYSNLSEGSHTFRVRAVDASGNPDPTPVTRTWRVDTPSETTLTSGPEGVSRSSDATFTFESTDPNATFECLLDEEWFTGCASPKTYSKLFEGSHTFQVRDVDANGSVDLTPATRTWTVDRRGPKTSVKHPKSGVYMNDEQMEPGEPGGPVVVLGMVIVRVEAIDEESGVSSVEFEVNGEPVDPSRINLEGNGEYSYEFRPELPGEYTITSRATNGSGLTESATVSVVAVPLS